MFVELLHFRRNKAIRGIILIKEFGEGHERTVGNNGFREDCPGL